MDQWAETSVPFNQQESDGREKRIKEKESEHLQV